MKSIQTDINANRKQLIIVYSLCVLVSHVQLFVALWTIAHQAPLSMEFSRQDTRMGCHFLLQGYIVYSCLSLSTAFIMVAVDLFNTCRDFWLRQWWKGHYCVSSNP